MKVFDQCSRSRHVGVDYSHRIMHWIPVPGSFWVCSIIRSVPNSREIYISRLVSRPFGCYVKDGRPFHVTWHHGEVAPSQLWSKDLTREPTEVHRGRLPLVVKSTLERSRRGLRAVPVPSLAQHSSSDIIHVDKMRDSVVHIRLANHLHSKSCQ